MDARPPVRKAALRAPGGTLPVHPGCWCSSSHTLHPTLLSNPNPHPKGTQSFLFSFPSAVCRSAASLLAYLRVAAARRPAEGGGAARSVAVEPVAIAAGGGASGDVGGRAVRDGAVSTRAGGCNVCRGQAALQAKQKSVAAGLVNNMQDHKVHHKPVIRRKAFWSAWIAWVITWAPHAALLKRELRQAPLQ